MQNLKLKSLNENKIKENLNTKLLGKDLYFYESVTSTFDVSESLNLNHGTLIVAKQQTNGRGREKRQWASPFGGIYFSLILLAERENIGSYTAICALSVQKAIEKIMPCLIKWPNDIITKDGKKVCGILTKAKFINGSPEFINVGIGINANSSVSGDALPYAVSISDVTGEDVDENQLLADIVLKIENYLEKSDDSIREEFEKVCKTVGSHVRVIYPDEREIKGKCTKILGGFELELITDEGKTVSINSGEASVRGIYGENYV